MTRVIESLHEYTVGRFEVRFWQAEGDFANDYPNRSRDALEAWMMETPTKLPEFLAVAVFLSELPYCNAVQVCDSHALTPAVLIYPDWP